MNRKDAEEIIKQSIGKIYPMGNPHHATDILHLGNAQGFLEGYAEAEKRSKVLIEALKALRSDIAFVLANSSQSHIVDVVKISLKYADSVIAEYRREGELNEVD